MTSPTTEAQIALAREIVAQDWQHLGYPRYADEARAGEFDNDDDMRIAIAAIQATTDRTLKWLEAEYGNSANNSQIPITAIHMIDVIRRCIRDGEHIKDGS